MHERAATEGEERLASGLPVLCVLLEARGEVLREVGLELDRRHRDAVHEEHEVDPVAVLAGVTHLPHDTEAVGGEVLQRLRIELIRWPLLEERELGT